MKHIFALLLPLAMMVTVPAALADTVSGTGTAKGLCGDAAMTITPIGGVITEGVAKGAGSLFPMPSRRQKSRVPLANRAPP